jgi:hydrogenase-4 component B
VTAPVALLLVGLLVLGGGACGAAGRPRAGLAAQAVGLALLGAAGAWVLVSGHALGAGFSSDVRPAFGLDRLSGLFMVLIAVVGAPAAMFARDTPGRHGRTLAVTTGVFLLVLVGFVGARDVSTFLGFWELMTLVPAVAILLERQDREARHGVFVYLAITHIGGAGVWVSMLVLAWHGALGGHELAGGLGTLVACSSLIGFSTKAGLMPFHSWLPRAHPLAPAHISAVMSGVMIKLALYGLIRVLFQWLAPQGLWVGLVLTGIGVLSCLGGVLYALMQHELKRLLAFSSIENVGIVAAGLGASLVFARLGHPLWSAVAFAAALLHALNHAVFKGLLFLGAGALSWAVGALELDSLGGLLRRMPWTGAAFALGAMAIAGLPPLNGFASEWLTLQSLLHLGVVGPVGVALAGALGAAALAGTAALAVYSFAKVIGLVLLGEPRRAECAVAQEVSVGMRASMAFLAGSCVVLGVAPGVLLPALAALGPGHASLPAGAGLAVPGTGSLQTLALVLALTVLAGVLVMAARGRRSASDPAWACGQLPGAELRWTSAGFTKPLHLTLEALLRPHREASVQVSRGVVQAVVYEASVPHLFDTLLYGPVRRWALRGARAVRRLQSGSLRAYLLYLLGVLGVLLALARAGLLA